jgi:hypothetical protein
MGLLDDADPLPVARPRGRAVLDAPAIAPVLPAQPRSGRARPTDPGALFDAPTPMTQAEARLMPLRAGCRGRAEIMPATKWNIDEPPPGLMLRTILWRDWGVNNGPLEPHVCFLGMNPALANATHDDHTSNCYIEFTLRLGYESYCAVNLSPIVATDPAMLSDPACDPWITTGTNQTEISARTSYCKVLVLCFGSLPRGSAIRREADRVTRVLELYQEKRPVLCYGITADGSPRHLSRMGYDVQPQIWKGWP